ncbi:MAG: glycoside hydrolase 5 family protein [Saccharofermentanales bacterium]
MGEVLNQQNLYFKSAMKEIRQKNDFSRLANRLKKHKGVVIGVFNDHAFDGCEVPSDLRFEHFEETWGRIPGALVVPLDVNQVRSYSVLFKGKMDILVFPYGSVFPMDAFGLYSAQTFNHFLKKGGAVMTTGGIPFMKQASPEGEFMSTDTPEKMTDVFDKWVSKFGIKYYENAILPTKQKVNTFLLPSLAEYIDAAPNRFGIIANNSSHEPVPRPPHGNVFPERYPVRNVIPLMTGEDDYGTTVSTSALFTQDHEDGSRRIHFAHEGNPHPKEEGNPHPLSPSSAHFGQLMTDLYYLLANRIVAADIQAEYACYRKGDIVRAIAKVINYDITDKKIIACFEISDMKNVVYSEKNTMNIKHGENLLKFVWIPDMFDHDEYKISISIEYKSRIVSYAENAFVAWDESKLADSPEFGIRNEYFTFNGKGTFITGTNYYESTRGEIMWYKPNVINILHDFHTMHDSGVNMIRPHYHHLKWFRDYLLYSHDRLFPYFKDLLKQDDPMPDERGWRIWDLFIYLSHKYGLIYNGDLFTLVPEEMGDPRGWFGTVEAVYDLDKREVQKDFIRLLEKRYADLPGISWDLFNEPYRIPDADVGEWASDLRAAFNEAGPNRLITVGGPFEMGDSVDYDCPHGRLNEDFVNDRQHPVLLQELHIDKTEPIEKEIEQAEDLRRIYVSSLRSGVAGICPWSWTRQMRLWQDTYEHHHTFPMEKWDDRLGLNTHDDGTMKIAGQVFKDIALMLRGIDFVKYDTDENICITTSGMVVALLADGKKQTGNSIYHLDMQARQCFAAMDLGKIALDDKILISGPPDKYIHFFVKEKSFGTASELFVKSEGAGNIKISRSNVKSVELIDYSPSKINILSSIVYEEKNGYISVKTDIEMSRYWIRVLLK